jgi:ABC-type glycerol-3-phosphate transport system substrate-binding protein
MALTTVINMKEELDDIIKLKLSRREALSKTAKIAIGAIIAAAIAGGGGYYAYTSLYKPKATVRVVAIAHAAPGMKAVAEEDFMKKYPNIEIETLLFDWETGRDRQIHDFSTRAGEYDVYMWDCIYTGAFAPHCYPVEDLKAKYPDAEIFTNYADFLPTVDKRYCHWGGKRIGYTICSNVMAMFYRKDLWQDPKIQEMYRKWIDKNIADLKAKAPEIGLDPNKIPTELVVPKVLEDVYAIGRFFTRKFNPDSPVEAGNTIMAMRTHTIHWEYCWLFAQWRNSPEGLRVCGKPVEPWGDLFTEDGRIAFDPDITDMGIKVMKMFKEFCEYVPNPMQTEWSECMELLGRGHAAMWAGSWASTFIDFIEKAPEEYPETAGKIACAPSPGVPIDGTWQVGVSKYSKVPREAWLYCQYLVLRESMIKQWKVSSSFPVARSVIEELAPQYPGIFKEVFLESLLRAGFRNFVPENPLLEDSIAKWTTEYVAGRIDAETATRELTKEWKAILKLTY